MFCVSLSHDPPHYDVSVQNRNSGLEQESDLKSFRKLSDTKIYAAESGTALISIKQP